jgi:hypothetical protein
MKTRLNNFSQKTFNISHTFCVMISFTQSRYSGEMEFDFVTAVKISFSFTVIFTPHYAASQIKNWDMKDVYSRQVRE